MSQTKEKRLPGFGLSSLTPEVRRRLTLLLGGGAIVLALLILLPDHPQSAPARRSAKTAPRSAAAPVIPAAKPRPLKDYSSLMGRNLFQPLVSDRVRRPAPSTAASLARPGGFNPPAGMKSLPPLTLRDVQNIPKPRATPEVKGWEYIGSVTVDNVPFALMLNTSTGDTGYYRAGERFGSGIIQSIGANALVLASEDGLPIQIPKTSGASQTPARTDNSGRGSRGSTPQGSAAPASPQAPVSPASAEEPVEAAQGTDALNVEQNDRQQRRMERRQRFRQNGLENSNGAERQRGGGRRNPGQRRETVQQQGVAQVPAEAR